MLRIRGLMNKISMVEKLKTFLLNEIIFNNQYSNFFCLNLVLIFYKIQFSDDEDIKHEVRSKNDSTKEIINKHIIKKDQAVDQKSFVDIKPAVCLSTPPVKKRPTVRVTEPSKQHRKLVYKVLKLLLHLIFFTSILENI